MTDGPIQLGGNELCKRMSTRSPSVGHSPHFPLGAGPAGVPVLYSPAIQHLGLIRPWTTESGGSRGLGLTVWIMRARQGREVEPLPVRAVPECQSWGTHSGGASHLLASGGLATPPGSSTPELPLVWALNELNLELIEFRELPSGHRQTMER